LFNCQRPDDDTRNATSRCVQRDQHAIHPPPAPAPAPPGRSAGSLQGVRSSAAIGSATCSQAALIHQSCATHRVIG
jgi:hypothetical protein